MNNTNEGYPKGWIRLNLMINEETGEMYATGGDREPGDGDMPYIGLEILKQKIKNREPVMPPVS